jgi:hypothetical protein
LRVEAVAGAGSVSGDDLNTVPVAAAVCEDIDELSFVVVFGVVGEAGSGSTGFDDGKSVVTKLF